MTRPTQITDLGEVMQLAFVPADVDGGLKLWIETMGAGPIFALDPVKLTDVKHRGVASNIDFPMVRGY